MRKRDPRLWFPLALLAAASLLTLAVLMLPKPARPTGPQPPGAASRPPLFPAGASAAPRPDAQPWVMCMTLEERLRERAPGLRVVHPEASGVCYVFDGPADVARLNGLRPEEGYADRWRGLLLCVADPPPHAPDGDHGCHAGDFYLFGDVELLAKVRPAAEAIHFGPRPGPP